MIFIWLARSLHVPCNHLTGVHLLEFSPSRFFSSLHEKMKPSHNMFPGCNYNLRINRWAQLEICATQSIRLCLRRRHLSTRPSLGLNWKEQQISASQNSNLLNEWELEEVVPWRRKRKSFMQSIDEERKLKSRRSSISSAQVHKMICSAIINSFLIYYFLCVHNYKWLKWLKVQSTKKKNSRATTASAFALSSRCIARCLI